MTPGQDRPRTVQRWREKRGLTVRALAQEAGVSYVTVVRIEGGHVSPTVAMLEKLAGALGIEVRDFFPARASRAKRRQ